MKSNCVLEMPFGGKKQRKTIEWERLEISSRKLDTKGTFHTKMGSIKDRNGMDLTEAEDEMARIQPCPPPGDLPNPGIEPASLMSACIGRWILYH